MSANNGGGSQNPLTKITAARHATEDFFQTHMAVRGRPGSSPRTRLAMCTRKPEKISTRKETKKTASTREPLLNPARRMVNSLWKKLKGGEPVTARVTMRNAAPVNGIEWINPPFA